MLAPDTMKKLNKAARLALAGLVILGVFAYVIPWHHGQDKPSSMKNFDKHSDERESQSLEEYEKTLDMIQPKDKTEFWQKNKETIDNGPGRSNKQQNMDKLRGKIHDASPISPSRKLTRRIIPKQTKYSILHNRSKFTNIQNYVADSLPSRNNAGVRQSKISRKHSTYQNFEDLTKTISQWSPVENRKWHKLLSEQRHFEKVRKYEDRLSRPPEVVRTDTPHDVRSDLIDKQKKSQYLAKKTSGWNNNGGSLVNRQRVRITDNRLTMRTPKMNSIIHPIPSFSNTSIPNDKTRVDSAEDHPYDITIVVPSINRTYVSKLLRNAASFIDRPPVSVNVINRMWQKVLDPVHEYYLYSAYFDDRPTLDNPAVRVISILENPTPQLLCVMWYKKTRTAMLSVAEKMKIGVRYPHQGKKLDPSILSCQIPNHVAPPDSISIVPVSFPLTTTLLRVQIPEKVKQPYDFGACVSVSYWQHDLHRVIEWMELQKLWGLSEVTIYNDNMTADSLKVFQYYANQRFVDLREITNIFNDNSEISYWMNMSPAINDCMYRNMYRYKKIVCIDIDELIVPRQDRTYKAMIERFDQEKPQEHPYKSYMFRNVYFFLDFGPVRNDTLMITQSYLQRAQPSSFGYSVKCITDPMVCEGLQNHVCWHVVPKYKYFGWLAEVTPEIAMNQHYKYCHLDYLPDSAPHACANAMANSTIDTTMLRFATGLKKNADTAFGHLGLL